MQNLPHTKQIQNLQGASNIKQNIKQRINHLFIRQRLQVMWATYTNVS
jgi:hypothetical protein